MGSKQTGSTTSTTNSSPWAPQQPYLEQIFGRAQDLYENHTPQYFPGQTYAAQNGPQSEALSNIYNLAHSPPTTPNAVSSENNILNGSYLYNNPALANFMGLAAQGNVGNNNLGTGELLAQAGGITNPALPTLSALGSINAGAPGVNPGSGILQWLASYNPGNGGPGSDALQSYASGAHAAYGNPYTNALASNLLSHVVPSIESQFINSGTLSSPEAARATASGATSALAPSLFQQFNQEEQNQLGAAQNLAGNYMAGFGQQAGAANQLANTMLSGTGQQIGALGTLGSQALTGAGLQQGAASTLGSQAIQGLAQQIAAGSGLQNTYGQGIQQMLMGLGLAPTVQSMPYTDQSQLYSVGATQQQLDQQSINDAVQRYNWQQTLPYNQLNQYISQVTGNYGGVTTANQPIIGNPVQSAMSTLGGVGQAAGSAMSILPFLAKSDRRLKEDIVPLGRIRNGLPMYAFKYKGEPLVHIGVMADEVEQFRPEAVIVASDGYKLVNYELAAA
jgi:hypothetical protein